MSPSNDLKAGFFQECDDLLEMMFDGFSTLEEQSDDMDTVNAVFRAVHSIKGGAGAFALEALVEFAHALENVLDDVRSGKIIVEADLMQLLLQSGDRLADLVDAARHDRESDPNPSIALIERLEASLSADGGAEDAPPVEDFVPITIDLGGDDDGPAPGLPDIDIPAIPDAAPTATGFKIAFKAHKTLYSNGHDPAILFRQLEKIGNIQVTVDADTVPMFGQLNWEEAYFEWTILLETEEVSETVETIFEFVEGICDIEIETLAETSTPDRPTIDQVVADGPIGQSTEATPPTTPQTAPVSSQVASAPVAKPSEQKPKATTQPKATIRVDLDRVDRLINLVGELVISEAMLTQSVGQLPLSSDHRVEAALGQLKQLSSELQESVMAIRAQPVKPLFQRMSRIVREAAQAAGKNAKIVTEGDATEVDKTVIERLVDPLTHMIRNAIDHGIENEDDRVANGKSPSGTVTLSAAHRSGRVVIELKDDGAGINREKVLKKAVEKGLVDPSADLSDADIDNLLFLPGFSTADSVSNLSGRGVGMDVVKNEIQALGGRVVLKSTSGEGTVASISLPLTLAVLEGMVVDVSSQTVVVPTTVLRETIHIDADSVQTIGVDNRVISVADTLIPIVDLGAKLGFRDTPEDMTGKVLLLIETENGRRIALAVDAIVEQREVVIKGFQENYGYIEGIAAATILGDGRIALIVDTEQLSPQNREVEERLTMQANKGVSNG